MLRIDAKSTLFLWKEEKTLSPTFLKGFTIAMILHLALLFGLRIHSQPASEEVFMIEPVAVEVDLGPIPTLLPAPVQVVHSPMQSVTPPTYLELPRPSLIVERPFFTQERLSEADFSEVERIEYEILEDDDLG